MNILTHLCGNVWEYSCSFSCPRNVYPAHAARRLSKPAKLEHSSFEIFLTTPWKCDPTSMYMMTFIKSPARQGVASQALWSPLTPPPCHDLNIHMMHRYHRSHFDSGYGCSPLWLDYVSCPDTCFAKGVIFIISTAFAIAVGVFRENKGRSWSHAANIAATRYLFDHKWDVHTLRSYIGVTTPLVYQNWARQEKQEVLTDLLPEGAKLHWVGARRDAIQDRVFLYFHGESPFLVLHKTLLNGLPKPYCLQEGASSFLRDPTVFNSCAPSRKTYLHHVGTLASPYWNTVSPARFQRTSLYEYFDDIGSSPGS